MCVKMGVLLSKIERVLSKEIHRQQLKTWDHIYTWRPDNSKFHGIYDNDNKKVIHITPRHAGQKNWQPYDVVYSSMDEFLDGGKLYRFEYGVNLALFLAKPQGWATCTHKSDDKPEFVKKRATDFLVKGFPVHHRFRNNSEDFAVNCKTGLLRVRVSRSGQAASLLGCALFILVFPPFVISSFAPASLSAWVTAGVVVYCICRKAFDMKLNGYAYRHEIFAREEVEELDFRIGIMVWCVHLGISWVYLVLEVASDIFIFVKNSRISTFGAECCLAISRWINYYVEITSIFGAAIPTPIKMIVFVAWEIFVIYKTVQYLMWSENCLKIGESNSCLKLFLNIIVVIWEIFTIYKTIQHQVQSEIRLKTTESNSFLNLCLNILLSREYHVCVKIAGVLWSKIQRVLSKKIQREQLKPGDHIYTWRPDNSKSHGIYDGDNEKVIHVTPRHAGQENSQPCGVVSSSIDDFLDGGKLYLFEYGVNPALFLAKPQGGATCTLIAETPESVKRRACFFLDNGFPVPHLHKNKSEVFAVYCKTKLLSNRVSRSEQAASLLTCAIPFLLLSRFTPASLTGWAATGVAVYCIYTLASDIGARPDVMNKVAVDKLADVEVKELGFLSTLMDWISLVFLIWLYLVFAVPECIMLFCGAIFQGNFKFRSWLMFNKISVDQLQPGDHIYKWKGYAYTHHGIYAGKREVLHVVRDSGRPPLCFFPSPFDASNDRVESIKIDDFASGGELYRYDYGVKLGYFIARIRGGSCSLASIDQPHEKYVLHRANFLLKYKPKKGKKSKLIRKGGFGNYDLLNNNCEDFAIYCRTELVVADISIFVARSGQIACLLAVLCGFLIDYSNPYVHSNLICMALVHFCIYSTFKVITDTKNRWDTCKIPVEILADPEKLADFKKSDCSKLVYLSLLLKLVLASTICLWTWWCPVSLSFGMGTDWGIECGNQKLKGITMSIMLSLMFV